MKKLRNKNKAGFTLIELLVVIAIIGLLASVVLLALNGAREKSREAKRLADVRQMASAFELYFNDKNSYPTQAAGLFTNAYLTPTYIGQVPVSPLPADDPSGSTPCSTTYNTQPGNSYVYAAPAVNNVASTYSLSFCLGSVTGGYSAGIHTLTQAGIQ